MSQDQIDIKKALNERDGWQVWWRLLRPHTLTASFIPVLVGTLYAVYQEQTWNGLGFVAMMVAAILIQSATNMFNEYYDYVRGLDTEQSVGIGGTIVRDGVAPKTVRNLGIIFFAISILLGVYIAATTSWWIAVIGAGSMLIGYLYTGGPIPIAYTPFGEFFSGFLMGTVMIGISYYVQALTVTQDVIIISIPIAIFIGAILLANNIRDLDGDQANGRKTLAILIGRKNAIILLAAMFTTSYLLTLIFIVVGLLPLWALITLLSIKKATDAVRGFIGKTKPLEMMPAMVATGKTNTIYGFLLVLALLCDHFV